MPPPWWYCQIKQQSVHREGWRSFGLDCGLPVRDPKSKTFTIRDWNSNVPYTDLREVRQLPEKPLAIRRCCKPLIWQGNASFQKNCFLFGALDLSAAIKGSSGYISNQIGVTLEWDTRISWFCTTKLPKQWLIKNANYRVNIKSLAFMVTKFINSTGCFRKTSCCPLWYLKTVNAIIFMAGLQADCTTV